MTKTNSTRKLTDHFLTKILDLLIISIISLTSLPVQSFDKNISCTKKSIEKTNAIKKLTQSREFTNFSKRFPKGTKFLFPEHGIVVRNGNGCVTEISVYIDEGDHISLAKTFEMKNTNFSEAKNHKESSSEQAN